MSKNSTTTEDLELEIVDEKVKKLLEDREKIKKQIFSTAANSKKPINQTFTSTETDIPQSTATIDLAGKKDDKSEKDMSLFEKLEEKILENLKETDMHDWRVWLDLALLYQKYNEIEKAVKIYALVLKHATGREKEIARDGLIALS